MFRSNILLPLFTRPSFEMLLKQYSTDMGRQSHMLKKLMSGKKRPTWKWNDSPSAMTPKDIFNSKKSSPAKVTSRRVIVLNKMFMRHVSELIATGQHGQELIGLGLEITNVLVCQRYHGLNIFWTATGTNDLDYVEEKLESMSKRLRHELTQMQLMGNIPHIKFVRDKQLSYFAELDGRLAIADFGPDHEESDSKSELKKDFRIELAPSTDLKEINSTLPPMRHDVLGLDRSLIIGRIKQHMTRSKQAWKTYEENKLVERNSPIAGDSKPFSSVLSFEDIREEAQNEKRSADILRDFLQKRKLVKKVRKTKDNPEFNSQVIDEENWYAAKQHENDFDEDIDWIEDDEELRQYDDIDRD